MGENSKLTKRQKTEEDQRNILKSKTIQGKSVKFTKMNTKNRPLKSSNVP